MATRPNPWAACRVLLRACKAALLMLEDAVRQAELLLEEPL